MVRGNQTDWERGRERQPELFRESIWRLASSYARIMFSWLFVDHQCPCLCACVCKCVAAEVIS